MLTFFKQVISGLSSCFFLVLSKEIGVLRVFDASAEKTLSALARDCSFSVLVVLIQSWCGMPLIVGYKTLPIELPCLVDFCSHTFGRCHHYSLVDNVAKLSYNTKGPSIDA
jgi:hypothetical protein